MRLNHFSMSRTRLLNSFLPVRMYLVLPHFKRNQLSPMMLTAVYGGDIATAEALLSIMKGTLVALSVLMVVPRSTTATKFKTRSQYTTQYLEFVELQLINFRTPQQALRPILSTYQANQSFSNNQLTATMSIST